MLLVALCLRSGLPAHDQSAITSLVAKSLGRLGPWSFLIRPWTADEVIRAKAGRLSPVIHGLAAVLANSGARVGGRRFSGRHPIHRAAVALVLTGKPFEESAHATEYARPLAQFASLFRLPPHNRRGQQSFSARMIAFDVAKFFWPLDEAPLSALLFIRCLRVGRQSLDSFRG